MSVSEKRPPRSEPRPRKPFKIQYWNEDFTELLDQRPQPDLSEHYDELSKQMTDLSCGEFHETSLGS